MQLDHILNRLSVYFFDKKMSSFGIMVLIGTLTTIMFFQNCSQPGSLQLTQAAAPLAGLAVCEGISCNLNPLTEKPTVTTILIALGSKLNDQLVVNGSSSQLIAETVIRYTSPVSNPKILVVQDHLIQSENPEDTFYVTNVLLSRYEAHFIIEPVTGLTPQDVQSYDLVWFNNPGYPMSSKTSLATLLGYKGGVVMQGDDLAHGTDFSVEELTHLKYIDNGTSVTCGGVAYAHDNEKGYQYKVTLNRDKMPAATAMNVEFRYGNDIDNTEITSNEVEVLSYAQGGPEVCQEKRPAIVRYVKK